MSARMAPFLSPAGAVTLTSDERAMSRDEILRLQRILASLGFNNNGRMVPDGVIGQNTRAAVSAYQTARGLRVDGRIGPQTVSALNAEPSAAGIPPAPSPGTPTPTSPNVPATVPPATPSPSTASTVNTPSRSNWPLAVGVGAVVIAGAYFASRENRRGKGW